MEFLTALSFVTISSVIIMYGCNSFEVASNHLGRNMAPSVKGATINAIGSSLPELMTAMILLFFYQDQDGFSAGIATTAGSAVFNALIIPTACIFAVRYCGVKNERNQISLVRFIEIGKKNIVRDGLFLLAAEIVLIWFLSGTEMMWWMGGVLILIYICYFFVLKLGFGEAGVDDEEEANNDENNERPSWLKSLITLDFNNLLFAGKPLTAGSSWVVISLATIVIGLACWLLAHSVVISANYLGVPTYFTALIFAAAATSVPDTVLSIKDALKGNYDDAISNALGSNTFDITVSLGLPLLLYGLIYGSVSMAATTDGVSAEIQSLRIVLLCVTLVVLALFLIPKKITVHTAWVLLGIYMSWIGFVLHRQGLVF